MSELLRWLSVLRPQRSCTSRTLGAWAALPGAEELPLHARQVVLRLEEEVGNPQERGVAHVRVGDRVFEQGADVRHVGLWLLLFPCHAVLPHRQVRRPGMRVPSLPTGRAPDKVSSTIHQSAVVVPPEAHTAAVPRRAAAGFRRTRPSAVLSPDNSPRRGCCSETRTAPGRPPAAGSAAVRSGLSPDPLTSPSAADCKYTNQ